MACQGEKWWLTGQGVEVRKDIENGKLKHVCDFVMKVGFFETREGVRDQGSLLQMEKKTSAGAPSMPSADLKREAETLERQLDQIDQFDPAHG